MICVEGTDDMIELVLVVLGELDLLVEGEEVEDELSNEERDLWIQALDIPARPDDIADDTPPPPPPGLDDRLMSLLPPFPPLPFLSVAIGDVIDRGELDVAEEKEGRPPLFELLLEELDDRFKKWKGFLNSLPPPPLPLVDEGDVAAEGDCSCN